MDHTWWEVLKTAREVGSEGKKDDLRATPFTAADLSRAAEFKGTDNSRPEDIAAGWISKLVRWGYVRVLPVEAGVRKAGRPRRHYELTRWGLTKKAPGRFWWEASEEQKKKKAKPKKIAANPKE